MGISVPPWFDNPAQADFASIRRGQHDVRALKGFGLLIEHLHAFQPPCLRGSVQLPQVAQRLLAWTADRSHRLEQRPVGVILTVPLR